MNFFNFGMTCHDFAFNRIIFTPNISSSLGSDYMQNQIKTRGWQLKTAYLRAPEIFVLIESLSMAPKLELVRYYGVDSHMSLTFSVLSQHCDWLFNSLPGIIFNGGQT